MLNQDFHFEYFGGIKEEGYLCSEIILKVKDMINNYLFIDGLTKDFILEVYYRVVNDSPDCSEEYSEEVEMTVSELAEQVVTGQVEDGENVIKVHIAKSAQDFLAEVHEHFEKCDGMLFASLDMTEAMESFLYSLGKYLVQGDFNKLFSVS